MRGVWLGLCVVLALSLVPLLFSETDIVRNAEAFPPTGIAIVLAVVITSWLSKAFKFWLLTNRLGQRALFSECLVVSLGCDFAFVASPAGIAGYPATVLLFGRIGVNTARAMTVAAADQILDLAFFAVTIPLALLGLILQKLPAVPAAYTAAGVLAGIAFTAAAVATFGRGLMPVIARGSAKFGLNKLRRIISSNRHWRQFRYYLLKLGSTRGKFLPLLALATAAQWLARYATLSVVLLWMGRAVPFAAVFLTQAISLHAGQWSGIPAGLGAADAILLESLRAWLPRTSLATALIVWRLATLHLTLVCGGLTFALLAMRKPIVAFAGQPALCGSVDR